MGKVPLLAIPDARFINRETGSIAAAAGGKHADLTEFGGWHFLYNQPFESTIETVLAEICIEAIANFGDACKNPSTPQINLIEDVIYQFLYRLSDGIKSPANKALQRQAIVIIDEVDAHLHPEWQRKIVHLLRKHFPRVQFIMTAHSPLVVGGTSVLRRDENGLELIECQQDFVGWPVDEIYRQIFTIEKHDPT